MTTPGRALLLSRIAESEWQERCMRLAARGGFHGIHIRQSHGALEAVHSPHRAWPRGADHDDAFGVPDLLLVREGELVFAELKRIGERPRPDQVRWAEWLSSVRSVRSFVWTPAHEREAEGVLLA